MRKWRCHSLRVLPSSSPLSYLFRVVIAHQHVQFMSPNQYCSLLQMHQITSLASHVRLWWTYIGQNLCICLRYLSAMLATSLPILDHSNFHATYAKNLSAGLLLECAAIHATNGSTRRTWAWTHVSTKLLHQTTSHGNDAAAACPTSLHHSLTLPYRNTLTPFRYSHLARQASPIVELNNWRANCNVILRSQYSNIQPQTCTNS